MADKTLAIINPFQEQLEKYGLNLHPLSVETLQINITKLCNQACLHCHVDSSPIRTEQMTLGTVNQVLKILAATPEIKNLDITGGAPELNPYFDYVVKEARLLGKHVMVRHNLTVTFDGNPQTKESKNYLPDFFAEHRVEVISSLPYYQEYFTDKQRGKGVFNKSIEGLKLLNGKGFGQEGSGLLLNLVYNPVGPFLPADQSALENQYRKELKNKFGIVFNNLFTMTNMPIHRFKESLVRQNQYDDYMTKLTDSFNPAAANGVMCRSVISVAYDGTLFDCDFNQMLNLPIRNGRNLTIFDFVPELLKSRSIVFDSHCLGCTAGAGSSCGGVTS